MLCCVVVRSAVRSAVLYFALVVMPCAVFRAAPCAVLCVVTKSCAVLCCAACAVLPVRHTLTTLRLPLHRLHTGKGWGPCTALGAPQQVL